MNKSVSKSIVEPVFTRKYSTKLKDLPETNTPAGNTKGGSITFTVPLTPCLTGLD
jgi:hypothetical protein